MATPPRIGLSEAEKDALLAQQQEMIERLVSRISELEALVGKPRKTSSNSHIPPSKDGFGKGKKSRKRTTGKRPSRKGKVRPLAKTPDKIAATCGHCGTDVSGQTQRCRHRYDHIDLPPIRPTVTRIELFGGRCGGCGKRYRAPAPLGMEPGTPFGPGIRSLLTYLHHSHHVGFERLSRISAELLGLTISEGAIANIFRRMGGSMSAATKAIGEKLLRAPFHVTPRGLLGPSFLAMLLFEKFGAHQPLNRQRDRYAREGVDLSLSTLADQVGTCTAALMPLYLLIAAPPEASR